MAKRAIRLMNIMLFIRRSENLMEGEWVELIHKDFEFDFKGEPTGHYAKGRIIEWYDNEFCLVELFCNGKRYKVSKQIVAQLGRR